MQVPRRLHLLTSIVEALQAAVARRQARLALQQQQFGQGRAEVEALNRWQKEMECLDVGGQRFHARSAVLSGHADHYLSALVSGNFAAAREADDSLFIDRDPQHFALILQNLREGTTSVPHGAAARGQLRREAQYYGLSESMGLSGTRTCLFVEGVRSAAIYNSKTRHWVEIEKPQFSCCYHDDMGPWTTLDGQCVRILVNLKPNPPYPYAVGVFNAVSWRWDVLDVIPFNFPAKLAAVGSRLFCQVYPSELVEYQGNGHWEPLPDMIVDRDEGLFGLCALGDSLVVVGGCDDSPPMASVEQFSLSERTWVQWPDMLCARIHPCVTVWQGTLIVAGGRDSSDEDISLVECFDPISGVWQPMPSLPHNDRVVQLVVFEDRLLAFTSRPSQASVVHKYSVETQSWQPFCAPVMSSYSAAVVTLPNEAVSARKI